MYLARKQTGKRIHYYIRQSVFNGQRITSRQLYDLGFHPEKYIIYPDNGRAFYFDPELVDAIEKQGVKADSQLMENVFWPFIDPETRRVIEMFTRPSSSHGRSIREQSKRCETEAFHIFDKRRIHYLRFGEIDQSRIEVVPRKIYRKLLDKSRDEIEQQFFEMERVLSESEKKNYAYAIFDIAGYFQSELARKFPQALDQDKVDEAFVNEICRINADVGFWADLGITDRLNDYLLRYAYWFFDAEFEGTTYLEDMLWQFRRRHHGFTPPPKHSMPVSEAMEVMGIKQQELDGMTVRTLTRQYRAMAHKHHPDKGGEHETFIRLNRAFSNLLRKIKSKSGKSGKSGYSTRRG